MRNKGSFRPGRNRGPAPARTRTVRVTDVAKVAGVASITVSRVINTPDSVAADPLRRVREAIERTGYVPKLLAGGLASPRSRVAGSGPVRPTNPVYREEAG